MYRDNTLYKCKNFLKKTSDKKEEKVLYESYI